jgi:hypothetical protein
MHIIDRVLDFFSSRPNRDLPPPHPRASVSPLVFRGGGGTLTYGRRGGWAQFGRGNRHCGTQGTVYVYFVYAWHLSVNTTTTMDRGIVFARDVHILQYRHGSTQESPTRSRSHKFDQGRKRQLERRFPLLIIDNVWNRLEKKSSGSIK